MDFLNKLGDLFVAGLKCIALSMVLGLIIGACVKAFLFGYRMY